MPNNSRTKSILAGVAAGILLALLIVPSTRWIVRSQAAAALPSIATDSVVAQLGGPVPPGAAVAIANARASAARARSDDLQVQIAYAATSHASDTADDGATQRLRALEARFPDSASLRANVLRHATRGNVILHRSEADLFAGYPPGRWAGPQPRQATAADLAAFDADAAAGERLEPNNGYFPLMRAAGLLQAHRDNEALAELHRAALATTWEEHFDDEVEGNWKLLEATTGSREGIARTAIAAAALFPQYSTFRSSARVAMYKAVEAEKAGHIDEGLAIRDDVLHCGKLMRQNSRSVIGALVGIAIEAISMTRPQGAPPLRERVSHGLVEHAPRQLLADYASYLRRTGHPERIEEATAEIDAAATIQRIVQTAIPGDGDLFGVPIAALAAWWSTGLWLLANAAWVLALGAFACLAMQSQRVRGGMGVPGHVRTGIALGCAAAIPATFAAIGIAGCWWLAASLPCVIALVWRANSSRTRLERTAACLVTCGVGVTATLVYAAQARGMSPLLSVIAAMVDNDHSDRIGMISPYAAAAFTSPLVALVTTGVLAVLSLIYRVPLATGVARGLRGVTLPITACLILAYALVLPGTLRVQASADYALRRTLEHEGKFMAELQGVPWP